MGSRNRAYAQSDSPEQSLTS